MNDRTGQQGWLARLAAQQELFTAPTEPPPLFSWHVATADPDCGACGVTVDWARAVRDVCEAIHATSGTCGVIQICWVFWLRSEYVYGPVVARCALDRSSAAIVWSDDRCGGVGLDDLFADARATVGEMSPGELAAGYERLEGEFARRRRLGLPIEVPEVPGR